MKDLMLNVGANERWWCPSCGNVFRKATYANKSFTNYDCVHTVRANAIGLLQPFHPRPIRREKGDVSPEFLGAPAAFDAPQNPPFCSLLPD